MIGAVSIIASIIGTFAVRTKTGNVERALYQGLMTSGLLAALAFIPVTYWLMRNLTFLGGAAAPHWWKYYLCALIGVAITALLFVITDYFTSTRFAPVKSTARASQTGHATNIIQGLAQGFQSTAPPAIVIALGILGAWKLGGGGDNGIYGIAVAVVAMLSLAGFIVALDAFGPITDNAGGIAEMAELPEEVRNVTDPLDAVGNTTKAVTKGYAIGSAALAALVLFNAFERELVAKGKIENFSLGNPPVLIGLLIGGLMVYLFVSLAMEAVGRAAGAVVEEVRRQFREKPGIMEGTEQPEYGTAVALVTGAAQREMILPSLIPIVFTLIVGLICDRGARRAADRRDRRRPVHGDLDDLGRWRLGQREEADRGRSVRRQGLGGPCGRGHRRHGRRSVQGHRRPRDQPDDQGRQHRRPVDHPADHLISFV